MLQVLSSKPDVHLLLIGRPYPAWPLSQRQRAAQLLGPRSREVGPLGQQDSCAILQRFGAFQAGQAEQLAALCGGLPLWLCLARGAHAAGTALQVRVLGFGHAGPAFVKAACCG